MIVSWPKGKFLKLKVREALKQYLRERMESWKEGSERQWVEVEWESGKKARELLLDRLEGKKRLEEA